MPLYTIVRDDSEHQNQSPLCPPRSTRVSGALPPSQTSGEARPMSVFAPGELAPVLGELGHDRLPRALAHEVALLLELDRVVRPCVQARGLCQRCSRLCELGFERSGGPELEKL